MCSVLVESDGSLMVGCSDGFLRHFKIILEGETYKIELIEEVNYGRCFLHITRVSIAGSSVFITMATDGFVCFWNGHNLQSPFYRLRHHASGINGFDVRSTDDGLFLIGTGGDDQAVAVSKFGLSPLESGGYSFHLLSTVIQCNVHQGQVTGIRFEDDNTLLSTGIDQMVYRISVDNVDVGQNWFSCISDIKGIEILPDTNEVFMYGCGFELIGV